MKSKATQQQFNNRMMLLFQDWKRYPKKGSLSMEASLVGREGWKVILRSIAASFTIETKRDSVHK
jgi:hypothetical protein